MQFEPEVHGKNLWPKNHTRSETVQRFSPTPFARNALVLRTLHELLRNKEALSSSKYHIFTKFLFTDLLQSLSSSWLKWLVLDQFTATSCSQRIRLEILTSCNALFSLFRLDPVAKEEKTKSKIEIRWHDINKMMYNKVAILIKHTDQTYCVLLYTSEIYNWIKKKYSRSFILATHAWKGEGGVRGRKNQQTDRREEIASSLVKTRDKLECKAMCLFREANSFPRV